jgi:hypothetical protein
MNKPILKGSQWSLTNPSACHKFLDPPGEKFDVEEPDLSDIIVNFLEDCGSLYMALIVGLPIQTKIRIRTQSSGQWFIIQLLLRGARVYDIKQPLYIVSTFVQG